MTLNRIEIIEKEKAAVQQEVAVQVQNLNHLHLQALKEQQATVDGARSEAEAAKLAKMNCLVDPAAVVHLYGSRCYSECLDVHMILAFRCPVLFLQPQIN